MNLFNLLADEAKPDYTMWIIIAVLVVGLLL